MNNGIGTIIDSFMDRRHLVVSALTLFMIQDFVDVPALMLNFTNMTDYIQQLLSNLSKILISVAYLVYAMRKLYKAIKNNAKQNNASDINNKNNNDNIKNE